MLPERASSSRRVEIVGVDAVAVPGNLVCGQKEQTQYAMNVVPYLNWINVMMDVFWFGNGTRLNDPLPKGNETEFWSDYD